MRYTAVGTDTVQAELAVQVLGLGSNPAAVAAHTVAVGRMVQVRVQEAVADMVGQSL